MADLDPTVGHEQAGKRPCLIFSVDKFNQSKAELIVVIPLTTKDRGIALHIPIEAFEGGLKYLSFIKCENIRSISTERLFKYIGRVSEITMRLVENRVRIILGL
ncbi:transcriptional modulator of MazE/toxin MazF [Candidatus Magnetobacterium bavaricum]|uniref:mRNA interferase n=1 Tax=Candidatus Magnetobacterium bavaricum TaxID=29290 RepID=A0A0F3GVP4_9BACT|nr:transcriptional modulator of MazE/toxin MazF [Candidatus Magnetobacterium bavaricum]